MEEHNDIFLAGGDALVYLAIPMHKIFHNICLAHPFSTYVSWTDFPTPSPL